MKADKPDNPCIVLLASAWGSRFGGINTFNTELAKSIGIYPNRNYDLICVVPKCDRDEVEDAKRYGVVLLELEAPSHNFENRSVESVISLVKTQVDNIERICWLGHDDKTGPLALEIRDSLATGRALLVHHMAHGAYQSGKKGDGEEAIKKREFQRNIFARADICYAVGPMLVDQLTDLLSTLEKAPPIEMVVPGLADPRDFDVQILEAAPRNFTAFIAGRLSAEDDRIKQGRLAVQAFGEAVRDAFSTPHITNAMVASPTLRMRGISSVEKSEIIELLRTARGGELNTDISDYTESRQEYFRDLASSSLAMMLSWHEGFGLTGWEAIACGVPVLIGQQSGLYRLLNNECQGQGLNKSVRAINISGDFANGLDGPNYTSDDVVAVCRQLTELGSHIEEAKQNAVRLRKLLLQQSYDWKNCASAILSSLEKHLSWQFVLPPSKDFVRNDTPPTNISFLSSGEVPEFLRLPIRTVWRGDLGLPPSSLLAARAQVASFDNVREAEARELIDWVNSASPALSFKLINGPAGIGKTYLALEVARRLTLSDTQAIWLSNVLPGDWNLQWAKFLRARRSKVIFLVLDYAEGLQETFLKILEIALSVAQDDQPPPILRVLLLARTSSWLKSLGRNAPFDGAANLINGPANSGRMELPIWPNTEGVRERSYRTALADYAKALDRQLIEPIFLPLFSHPFYERPLFLHLAALATLDGQRPTSALALIEGQWIREWQRWQKIHGTVNHSYDDWADLLAWIALRQGASREELISAMAELGITNNGLVVALSTDYPGTGRVAAIQPDLLVDALLRERLIEIRGDGLLRSVLGKGAEYAEKSLEVIGRLAADLVDAPEAVQVKGVLVDSFTQNWVNLGQALINAAHASEPGLGALLLGAWKRLPLSDRAILAITLNLPEYSVSLLELSTAIVRDEVRISELLVEAQPLVHMSMLAESLNRLANRLDDEGGADCRNESIDIARRVLSIYRQLALEQPAQYQEEVAVALNNLSNHLSKRGEGASLSEAIELGREAAAIFRTLAGADPQYQPRLASTLANLASHLSQRGGGDARKESLIFSEESLGIYADSISKSSSDRSVIYLPELARALSNHATLLDEYEGMPAFGRVVSLSRNAVEIERKLTEILPAVHRPRLASSLSNLSNFLAGSYDADHRDEGLSIALEALSIFRSLAKSQPDAFLPDLANSLSNLATHPRMHKDPDALAQATAWAREAVQINQGLISAQPFYKSRLGLALNVLSNCLSQSAPSVVGENPTTYAREALAIFRQLDQQQPHAYLPDVAMCVNNLMNRLSEEKTEAAKDERLILAREVVEIRRRLAALNPARYYADLGRSLGRLAIVTMDHQAPRLYADALAYSREAVGIFNQLNAIDSTLHGPGFATEVQILTKIAQFLGLNPTLEYADALQIFSDGAIARAISSISAKSGNDV